MNDTIILPIKKKWFDMILSGEKKEEYREIKPYYNQRLLGLKGANKNYPIPIGPYETPAKTITFINGYGHHRPKMVVEFSGLCVNFPKSEWCPPGSGGVYYVLELGKIIKTENLATASVNGV